MKTIKLSISILFLVVLCLSGCSDTKSVNKPVIIQELPVQVTNEKGEPVPGVTLSTDYTTDTVITGSDGKAILEDVPSTLIKITGKKQGCPNFSRYIKIDRDYSELVHFTIHSKLIVVIIDDCDRPLEGAEIKTVPTTQKVVTDENGTAILKNVPAQNYTLTIVRQNLSPVQRSLTLSDSLQKDIEIKINSEPPVVQIDEPLSNSLLSAYNVVFRGTGTDYEDGELPDSLLVWHSELDGELGTGRTLTVDKLSVGNHRITLTGYDGDSKHNSVHMNITVVSYNPYSYFPLFENSTWEYRHPEPEFHIINDFNVRELWTIKSLTVTVDDENRRISTVYYDRTIGSTVTHVKYELIDYLETDEENVYVTRTQEEMSEWEKNKDKYNPYSIMKVTTMYAPRFVILNNVSNMQLNTTYENTVKVETEWFYMYYNTPSSYFHESDKISTVTEVGDIHFVQTDVGQLEAAEITITQGKKTKKWWLTCGLGIVRLDYDISGANQTAILEDSNMMEYYRRNNPSKAAMHDPEPPYSISPAPKIYHITADEEKAVKELRNILKNMLPHIL